MRPICNKSNLTMQQHTTQEEDAIEEESLVDVHPIMLEFKPSLETDFRFDGKFHGATLLDVDLGGSKPRVFTTFIQNEEQIRSALEYYIWEENHFKILHFQSPRSPSEGYLPLPMTGHTFDELTRAYCLPGLAHCDILSTGLASFRRTSSSEDEMNLETVILQDNATSVLSLSSAVAVNKNRKSAFAMVFGEAGPEHWRRVGDKIVTIHWMSLIISILEIHASEWTWYVRKRHGELWEVESKLKMRLWLGTDETVDLKTVDLLEAHRSLNSFNVELAMFDLVCQTNSGLIQRLIKCCDSKPMEHANSCATEPEGDPKAKASITSTEHIEMMGNQQTIEAKDRIKMVRDLEFLQTWYEGMQARTTYITRRVETQLQTVYSMVSQRDSAVTLEIAQLSRDDNLSTREIAIAAAKDSATMRIIAYVTLAFLPATFVATFFSTSFFDFKPSDSQDRVSWWLWLYFVVSLPLTAGVLAVWRMISKQKEQELLKKIGARREALERVGTGDAIEEQVLSGLK